MFFLSGAEMTLYPLVDAIQCRSNIDIKTVWKRNRSVFPDCYGFILRKLKQKQVRTFHDTWDQRLLFYTYVFKKVSYLLFSLCTENNFLYAFHVRGYHDRV